MQQECLDRLAHPRMERYRRLYENSERWNGSDDLTGKTVVVYCEQGLGDIIQFARYLPLLSERGCRVIIHCPLELKRLFSGMYDEFIDRTCDDIPSHDFHIPSMSLPFVLNIPDTPVPYLSVTDSMELGPEFDRDFKIGIAWEGNPYHTNNDERSCPLTNFRRLEMDGVRLFCIQKEIHSTELYHDCEDMELYGFQIDDMLDTAKAINSLDLIVSVDTSVLHLAGAMGKKTLGLLSYRCDTRWEYGNWYPSILFLKQQSSEWSDVLERARQLVSKQLLSQY